MSTFLDDCFLQEFSCLSALFFDIDDTLSTDGKLTQEAYSALWQLKKNNISLISVTGRPAGWCDHIIRFWPVDAVIGENGAFAFFMRNSKRDRIDTINLSEKDRITKLNYLRNELIKNFPNLKFASDQAYREYDLAIDICEDVPVWDDLEVERLLDFCKQKGAKAKLSSIHVNTWFGDFDKASGIKHWISQGHPGVSKDFEWDNVIFVGDSPNDSPMFKLFSKSVGVNNISKYLPQLKDKPRWITKNSSGQGFCELSDFIIKAISQ